MAKKFVEAWYEGNEYIEVYKDKDGYIINIDEDDDYDDIYGEKPEDED